MSRRGVFLQNVEMAYADLFDKGNRHCIEHQQNETVLSDLGIYQVKLTSPHRSWKTSVHLYLLA